MKWALLAGTGVVIALVGILWTLQGLGLIGGSFMSGKNMWAVIGPVVSIAGLVMVAVGIRGSGAVRRRL